MAVFCGYLYILFEKNNNNKGCKQRKNGLKFGPKSLKIGPTGFKIGPTWAELAPLVGFFLVMGPDFDI